MRIDKIIEKLQAIWDRSGNLEVVVYEDNQLGDCAAYIGDVSEYDGTAGVHLQDAQILPCEEI